MQQDEPPSGHSWWHDRTLVVALGSGVFLLLALLLEQLGLEIPQRFAAAVGLLLGAGTFVPGALLGLARSRLGVALLMTIAAVGAVLLGHLNEAAALAFLFSLAEALEVRAMRRAKRSLRSLLQLIPDLAKIEHRDRTVEVPVSSLQIGDVLVVAAGERIATDGTVIAGTSSLDASAVTGESIPVSVAPGDDVAAGSMNGRGALRVRASAHGRDNSLTRIVELVAQAHAKKGDHARLADRIARPLVPAVLVVSTLIALFGLLTGEPELWIERALVVLVAASPCALAIAVPVTVISSIGAASKFGVVIKSGAAFEQMGAVRAVALDKTGTLTENAPRVVSVATAADVTPATVLSFAAALEHSSTHPLASAIVAAAGEAPNAVDVTETPGRGITGMVGASRVRVGNVRWIEPGPLAHDADVFASEGMTVVVVAVDGAPAGVIGIRDELRPEATAAVRMLQQHGLDVAMLTGDDPRTAEALARQAGITAVHAQQLPADKARFVALSSSRRATVMVGDGINDAPALASATVGIAMGARGSAAAIESADVAFTGHDLRLIPIALQHARRGRRIMIANIVLALLIIVALFPLALFGVVGLAGVVLIHEIAEVIVILNGVRAARRPKRLATFAHDPDHANAWKKSSLTSSY
ncbi:cation-translocating P-type ATPase [Humidisolicoccus flavus]